MNLLTKERSEIESDLRTAGREDHCAAIEEVKSELEDLGLSDDLKLVEQLL